jgi:hypothetical protein
MSTAANRPHSLLRRLWRRLGGQRGFVLPMTIGMCTMLTMAGTTVVAYSSSSARTSFRSSADQSAYALAEAGVNNAMAVLSEPSNNALNPYLLSAQTTNYEGGTVTYSGSLDEATATWTITATGLVRNPTGPSTSPVRRVLNVRVPVEASFQQPLNNMAWNYIWAKATGSACDMTIGQSVNVATPLFVEGNLCLQNTSTISNGPLVVKGALTLSQKANGVGDQAPRSTRPTSAAGASTGTRPRATRARAAPTTSTRRRWMRRCPT